MFTWNIGKPWHQLIFSSLQLYVDSCSWMIRVNPNVVFCSHSPPITVRCFSAHYSCRVVIWVTMTLLSARTSHLNYLSDQGISAHRSATDIFCTTLSKLTVSEVLKPSCVNNKTTPIPWSKSLRPQFWFLMWTLSEALDLYLYEIMYGPPVRLLDDWITA